MKNLILIVSMMVSMPLFMNAQNCGTLTDFSYTTRASSTPGNTIYDLSFETTSTSNGTKSVELTVWVGSTAVINATCYTTSPSNGVPTQYTSNGHDVATGTISLNWTGHTNDKCGGTTCASGITPLPVELISFNASKVSSGVLLDWTTASELNNSGFEVERSIDGETWELIGWVEGSGTTQEIKNYSFIDEDNLNQLTYYRLRQVDYDGAYEYSDVIAFETLKEDIVEFEAYPNPTSGVVSFNKEYENVKVSNSYGITVLEASEPTSSVDLSNLPNSVYFVEVTNEFGKRQTTRIIKN